LKNLNVWGDAGMIVSQSGELAERIRLYRNHGLLNRDEAAMWGCNSRLDSLQAVIGNRLIQQSEAVTETRIANARKYDQAFADLDEFIQVPTRRPGVKHVYHLYMIRVKYRDALMAYLNQHRVEAKIHYPIPMHLQPPSRELGYKEGDFPKTEEDSRNILTLPAHQYLTSDEIDYVIDQVRSFYLTRDFSMHAAAN
jgi:dTDP-4-amino-4,6-dideoxygalactose transaminase